MGPNGSGQFLAVRLSTVTERTVNVSTVTGNGVYGLLQNKPSTGEAADVGIFGPSKAVAGTTTITAGMRLMPDTSGCLIPYSSAADRAACGVALSVPSAVGEVFTAMIYGYGAQGSLA
jgi:hypothetical protein